MEGLKFELVERTCKGYKCGNKFKVLPKSKQKFCSSLCAGLDVPFIQVPNHIKEEYGYRTAKEAIEDEDESSD